SWLAAFQECGVHDFLGIDGPYVDPRSLLVDPAHFRAADLSRPIVLTRSFDLAICLEVAEHLPPTSAGPLVRTLTAAASPVLFSAALPGQGGTAHINEQWPEYWEALFRERGYQRLDPIRKHIWMNPLVEWWYRQNIYLYASGATVSASPRLQLEAKSAKECGM